jgi:hypothetical protein
MATSQTAEEMPQLSKLNISNPTKATNKKKKLAPVADSWEDDVQSSSSGESEPEKRPEPTPVVEKESSAKSTKTKVASVTTPSGTDPYPFSNPPLASSPARPEKRPEKSVTVVNRLIAGSLGIRVKRTEEQRKFDRDQIENEKRRRDAERTKKVEEENLKKSVWDD